jgi:death-on-curing protein
MITESQALEIHAVLIERFGGSSGLRDKELLNSALNRPYQTFDGNDLYPTTQEKAAAILESVVKNHPFSDGNKRTGYVLARLLLMNDKLDIHATEEEKYELVISISTGSMDFEAIKNWIIKYSR